jgi:hypothetical protein
LQVEEAAKEEMGAEGQLVVSDQPAAIPGVVEPSMASQALPVPDPIQGRTTETSSVFAHSNPEPVPPPMPTLEDLPPEVQDVLRQFKDQIGTAPEPFQRLIMTYLAPSRAPAATAAPAAPGQVQAPQPQVRAVQGQAVHAQAPQPQTPQAHAATAQAQAATSVPTDGGYGQVPAAYQAGSEPSPVLRVFPKADVPEGFQPMPSVLLYSWAANGFRPLRCLVVDVAQWGAKMIFIAICKTPIKALSAEGTIEDLPPKTPFAIPVDTDISNLVRPIVEDPTGAYETLIVPRSEDRGADGQSMLRFRPFLGVRIVKSTVWPPK